MAEVKLKQETAKGWEPYIKEEPESSHIKEEPEEASFHIINVKTEENQDKASVLHQREETNADDSDTDHSEDYSQEQAPQNKRSYAIIPPDSKSFSCSDCGMKFTRKGNLKRHMLVHTKEKTFKCPICQKCFAVKQNLSQHLETVHQIKHGPRPFSCSECGKSFTDKSELKRHESIIHRGEEPYKCSICEKSFTQEGSLNVHMKTHTREKPFVCTVCEKGFVIKADLRQHQRRAHYICPVCSEHFTERKNLNEHLKGHVEAGTLESSSVLFRETFKPFSCSECGLNFKVKLNLQRHVSSVHRGEKPHKCSVCEKRFLLKASLKNHMKTHSLGKPFVCSVCGKRFPQLNNLKKHLWTHPADKPRCPVCHKSLQSKYLPHHLKLFHFICPSCNKQFPDKNELEAHLKNHEDEATNKKVFSSSDSEKSFKTMSQIQTPISVHAGERPHKQEVTLTGNKLLCPVCHKSLVRQYLPLHLKLFHLTCPDCNKQFPDKNELEAHLRIHEEEVMNIKPFSCSDCGRRFKSHSYLQRHLKTHRGARPRGRLKPLAPRPVVNQGALLVPLVHTEQTQAKNQWENSDQITHPETTEVEVIWEPHIKEEPESSHIKEEPEEASFHIITVKTDKDQDKASLLHQREETNADDSDTDHSEDYSQEQAPQNKRSYAIISPDHRPISCSDHRPFSCSECGKNFKFNSDLQRHMSFVHRGERPHKCSVCEKGFVTMSRISEHQRLIHHICPVCSERFTEKKSLNEHLKDHVE